MAVAELVVAGGDYMGVWKETPKRRNWKSMSKTTVPIALSRNGSYDDLFASVIEAGELTSEPNDLSKLERKSRELKRGRYDEQGQPRSKKRFSNQDSSMVNNDRVSNPNSQGGSGSGSYFERSRCAKYRKQHLGKCRVGTDECFRCGKKVHKMRDCPTLMAKGRENRQASYVGMDSNAPKKNRFYALQAKEGKGANPNEGTGKS
ncbi:uncharacterized protein LOC125842896 [Solanum stenotomum]|uniref:uncharacterized protein LOC125842896 n=1 Tax=Solanum stenotomum TaxID=172797 RepID=UPI0020D02C8E|nr:uncharacterized protein LOC125842896 [Solanum stenotomum]